MTLGDTLTHQQGVLACERANWHDKGPPWSLALRAVGKLRPFLQWLSAMTQLSCWLDVPRRPQEAHRRGSRKRCDERRLSLTKGNVCHHSFEHCMRCLAPSCGCTTTKVRCSFNIPIIDGRIQHPVCCEPQQIYSPEQRPSELTGTRLISRL